MVLFFRSLDLWRSCHEKKSGLTFDDDGRFLHHDVGHLERGEHSDGNAHFQDPGRTAALFQIVSSVKKKVF